jgi:hypothetical protein
MWAQRNHMKRSAVIASSVTKQPQTSVPRSPSHRGGGEGDRDEPPRAGAAPRRKQFRPQSNLNRSGRPFALFGSRLPLRSPELASARKAFGAIRKSAWLAALHDTQWQRLGARFAARRQVAFMENDEDKRKALLSEIERQEAAERAALAAKQQADAGADVASQIEAVIRATSTIKGATP